jgi:hypothetical protein
LKDGLRYALEGRRSHVLWAEHLEAHANGATVCEQCTPAVVETAGDAAEQREWVRKYDVIIEALKLNSTPLMLGAIARISDEENRKARVRAVQHGLRYRADCDALAARLAAVEAALIACAEIVGVDGEAIEAARSGAMKFPSIAEFALAAVRQQRNDVEETEEELAAVRAELDEAQRALQAAVGKKITHGRHCTCTACAQEDWTNPKFVCGMHGSGCPSVYAPLGDAGERLPVPARTDEPNG